jgi:hypothetical protein
MDIEHSEIWYTYSSFISGPPPIRPEYLADVLLKSKITNIIFDGDGKYYLLEDQKVKTNEMKINISPDGHKVEFKMSDWPDDPFLKEVLYQCHLNYFSENKLLNLRGNYIDNQYIRFSLNEILLKYDGYKVHLYPFVTIYTSSLIAIIEFRAIIDYAIDIDSFINNFIHLSIKEFLTCYSNEYLSIFSKEIMIESPNSEKDGEQKNIDLENNTFHFKLYEFFLNDEDKKTLTNVALKIFDVIVYVLNKYFNFNKQVNFSMGDYWVHRPHVHIINFSTQENNARLTVEKNKENISKILLMTKRDYFAKEVEHSDLRMFDDFSRFYSASITLTIWSKLGLKNELPFADGNFNHLIFDSQVINRFIDYFSMIYEKPMQIILSCQNYEDILEHEEILLLLNEDHFKIARYGEIFDLLEYAKKELKIEQKEKNIENLIQIRKNELEHKKAKRDTSFSFILTILFGLLSADSLSNSLLKPLCVLLDINVPDIISWVISFGIIFIAIMMVYFKIYRKKQ